METLEKIKKTVGKMAFDFVMCVLVVLSCLWPAILNIYVLVGEGYSGFVIIVSTTIITMIWLTILTFTMCVVRHYGNYYASLG